LLTFGDSFNHGVGRKIIDKLFGVHAQGAEGREPRIEGAIVDSFGMKLLVNPIVNSDGEHVVNVAGARSESQAIERVKSLFLRVEWGNWELLLFSAQGDFRRERHAEREQEDSGFAISQLHGNGREVITIMNPK
jgi:hypothetical protein